MNRLFPENSYMGKCSCGAEFNAPKGTLHCSNCLYKRIVELEDLVEDIINAESADEKLRPMMYHVWLFKAKALKEPKT
jgi:hypothetical protein